MTSEEIKAVKQQLIDNPDIDVRVAQGAALYEIAYQLAKLAEREPKPHMDACRLCGHPFIHHRQLEHNRVGRAECLIVGCACDSFCPIVQQ